MLSNHCHVNLMLGLIRVLVVKQINKMHLQHLYLTGAKYNLHCIIWAMISVMHNCLYWLTAAASLDDFFLLYLVRWCQTRFHTRICITKHACSSNYSKCMKTHCRPNVHIFLTSYLHFATSNSHFLTSCILHLLSHPFQHTLSVTKQTISNLQLSLSYNSHLATCKFDGGQNENSSVLTATF